MKEKDSTKEVSVIYSNDLRVQNTPFNVATKTDEEGNIEVITLFGNYAINVFKCGEELEIAEKALEQQLEAIKNKDWNLIINIIAIINKLTK